MARKNQNQKRRGEQVEQVSVSPEVLLLVSLDLVESAIGYASKRCKGKIDVHYMDKYGIAVCFVMGKVSVLTIPQARTLIERLNAEQASALRNRDGQDGKKTQVSSGVGVNDAPESIFNEVDTASEHMAIREIARVVDEARAGIDLAATYDGREESWATLEPNLDTVFARYVQRLTTDPRNDPQAKHDKLRKAGVPEIILASDPPMTFYDWAVCLVGNVRDVWRGENEPQSADEWTEALITEYWLNVDAFYANPPEFDVF